MEDEAAECEGELYKEEAPQEIFERCICAFDRNTSDAWPCHLEPTWAKEFCHSCDDHAFCKKSIVLKLIINYIFMVLDIRGRKRGLFGVMRGMQYKDLWSLYDLPLLEPLKSTRLM